MKFILKSSFLLIFLFLSSLFGADYQAEAQAIKAKFEQALSAYDSGDSASARKLTQEAYFSHFENLEAGIRINLGQKKSYAMEKQFGNIRKAFKAGTPRGEIEAMIAKLNSEITEILPIIESGHKLVAQYQNEGEEQPQNSANQSENSAPNTTQNSSANSGENSANQTPNSDPNSPWLSVYNDFITELNNAKTAFDNKDETALKSALNKAKFDIYRNTRLEEVVRKYVSSKNDQMIQRIISNLLRDSLNMDEVKFNQSLKDLDDLLLSATQNLPSQTYALAPQSAQNYSESEVVQNADFSQTVANIKSKMAQVLALYEAGKTDEAIDESGNIYFDEYEESGMEALVGAKNSQLKLDTEASFNKISALISSGAPKEQIIAVQNELFAQLEESLNLTQNSSAWDLFLYSLIIILREGMEALIIVAAVIALLIKSGNEGKLKIVYSALAVAIVLSFATAWGISAIFGAAKAGQSREILEGAVMLVAVGLLFYVGFWLLSNANSKKWSAYISGAISQSLSEKDGKMLWWMVFLAVYREGAETVLFYLALIIDAKTPSALGMVGAGFIVGVITLLVVYILIKKFSLRIAIKPFFMITSAIIFYMSIVFVGKGIMELVEGKVFTPSIIEGLPTITWLGFYPYKESLIPQAALIVALIVGILIIKNKNKSISKENL
ncbi:MAG: FTR1 family protein [Campylobacter sp.]|nr:FTR1 family protein [Campylobacter sp.]